MRELRELYFKHKKNTSRVLMSTELQHVRLLAGDVFTTVAVEPIEVSMNFDTHVLQAPN